MDIDDETFEAIQANVNTLQENVMEILYENDGNVVAIASELGVPVLHVKYAMLALKGMGLVEEHGSKEWPLGKPSQDMIDLLGPDEHSYDPFT